MRSRDLLMASRITVHTLPSRNVRVHYWIVEMHKMSEGVYIYSWFNVLLVK
jgi:hypothetical protein